MVTNDRENKDFKFIINTFTKWDEPPRARHQVATEISKHYDTIFISANKTGLPKLKKKTINDNFTAISKRINNILIYRYHLRCERTVAEKANFCIATSGILKNKILNYTDRVYEIPLGGPSIKEFDIKIKYEIKNRHSGYINVGLVGYI